MTLVLVATLSSLILKFRWIRFLCPIKGPVQRHRDSEEEQIMFPTSSLLPRAWGKRDDAHHCILQFVSLNLSNRSISISSGADLIKGGERPRLFLVQRNNLSSMKTHAMEIRSCNDLKYKNATRSSYHPEYVSSRGIICDRHVTK